MLGILGGIQYKYAGATGTACWELFTGSYSVKVIRTIMAAGT